MRKSLYVVALITTLITNRPAVWADEAPAPAPAPEPESPPMYRVSGSLGLGYVASADIHSDRIVGVRGTVWTPSAVSVSADLVGERRVGGGVWLDVALRAGLLTETPADRLGGSDFVGGKFAGAELGVAYRTSVVALRLTAGPAYFDYNWSYTGGDPDTTGALSSWGLTVRPELALESSSRRSGLSFALALGMASTFLVDADDPIVDVYLAFRIGQ